MLAKCMLPGWNIRCFYVSFCIWSSNLSLHRLTVFINAPFISVPEMILDIWSILKGVMLHLSPSIRWQLDLVYLSHIVNWILLVSINSVVLGIIIVDCIERLYWIKQTFKLLYLTLHYDLRISSTVKLSIYTRENTLI